MRKGNSHASARARLKLNERFLEDFWEHYEKNGKHAIEILFREKPEKYLFLMASFLPKEIDVTHTENKLNELPDERLEVLINALGRRDSLIAALRNRTLSAFVEIERRKDEETDRGEAV